MEMDEKVREAVEMINAQIKELLSIPARAEKDNDFDAAQERLKHWKRRTARLVSEHIHADEEKRFEETRWIHRNWGPPLRNLRQQVSVYRAPLLALKEQLEKHAQDVMIPPVIVRRKHAPSSRAVFIVHGHDETNTLKLDKLLRERWDLEPVILREEAGKGRTLIEKFEQEAEEVAYAIAVFTPDDYIKVSDTEYAQARPNVIFELGWFYGRMGRDKVCILFKKGTEIHSDLDGITRIEFNESVDEKVIELEKELKEADLL